MAGWRGGMSAAAHYSFALAYQWWLNCDSYYVAELAGRQALNAGWVRDIGETYLVNRTIAKGAEDVFAQLILHSGQGSDMAISERAIRLSLALERHADLKADTPASAASKVSWFVWPRGWTMYDRFAAKAVVGTPAESGLAKMERFYAALAMRGWDDALRQLRNVMSEFGCPALLAERTLDKYLFLEGSGAAEGGTAIRRIDGFLNALPGDHRDTINRAGEAVASILEPSRLLHRETRTDRIELKKQLDALRVLKREIA